MLLQGDRALRVLQVTPRFAPHVGGVETHVREVARRLPEHGMWTAVLTVDESGHLASKETLDEVIVRRVRGYPSGRDWLFAPALAAGVRACEPHVIHVQSYHTFVAPLAMAAAARSRIPFVLTFHGGGSSSPFRNRIRRWQLRALGPLARRAAALVAIADFEIRDYAPVLGVPRDRFVKIPNGADLPHVDEVIASPGKQIVSIGRLEKYKGHRLVLEAFPNVLKREPDARLWIAGAGPDQEALESLAKNLGVADKVEIGATDRPTLAARLKGSSLMVLLSEFESHPIAVIEAASLGVPAVVANNSGMAELAAQGYARAVELNASPEEHAAAMCDALTGPKPSPREDIQTWESCTAALAELYRRVAG